MTVAPVNAKRGSATKKPDPVERIAGCTQVTVTAMRPDRQAPGLIRVEVDGGRFATLRDSTVDRLGVAVGVVLTGKSLDALLLAGRTEKAYQAAVRLLTVRPRGVSELLARLRQKGHNPAAVAAAVGRLEDLGYLDDRNFAQAFARSRCEKGHGAARIVADLIGKGVDGELAREVVHAVVREDDGDQAARLRELIAKRRRQLGDLPPDVLKRRLVGFLTRRGFSGYEVLDAVDEVVRT